MVAIGKIRPEHVATTLSIAGAILLAAGSPALMPASLLLQILGGLLWCYYAQRTGQRPLLLVNVAFILIELIALVNWY